MKNQKIFILIIVLAVFLEICFLFYLNFNNLPKTSRCGIENCHGLDIKCGPNVPDFCTMEYQIGDNCRQYARCEIINGNCQLVENNRFKKCKSCVEKCTKDFKNNTEKQFKCEENCLEKIKKLK